MSPRRTRRGTIRESINESSTLSASKILRKTRSRVNKSSAKGSEEDSDSPVDLNNVLLNDNTATTSFLNDTSINTRKRRRKQELDNQNNTSSATVKEPQTSRKKNLKSTKVKKQIVDGSSLISEDESFSKKRTKDKNQTQDLISEDEEIEKKVLRKKIKFDDQNLSSTGNVRKTPEKIPQNASERDKILDADITPKSSPLNMSFTPNRSVKTPRKSPENLGSPKTHSHDSLKFLNIPRKLSIGDSPPSSENSLQQSHVNLKSVGSKGKNLKRPKSISQNKLTSPTLPQRPKFSKSPKIVFKTPKSKSSKKSPKNISTGVTVKKLSNVSKSPSPTKSQKIDSPSKSIENTLGDSLVNSNESSKQDIISQSKKTSTVNSSLEFKASLTSPLNSSKSKITPSQKKDTSIGHHSSSKAKKSPKFISPLSSSKTPKIVLVLKSKKSPTKSSKSITPSKVKKSPVKMDKSITPSKVKESPVKVNKNMSLSKAKKSPVKAGKSSLPSKTRKSSEAMSSSKSEKVLVKSPQNSTANKTLLNNTELSPRVIVNKLSLSQLDNSSLRCKSKQPTINLIPVDHTPNKRISIRKSKSPKSPKQAKVKSLTPASMSKVQINKSTINRVSLKNSTPVDALAKKLVNLKPSNTSTPRELKKHAKNKILSSNLSNNSIVFNGSPQSKSKVVKRLNDQNKNASNYQLLDDESEPSMNDSSLIPMSDVFDDVEPTEKNSTFEINKSDVKTPRKRSERNSNNSQTSNKNDTFEIEKNNTKNSKSGGNNTYELENPKTPALKNKITQRILNQTEIGKEDEQETKRNVKVHFASPDRGNQGRTSTLNRIGTPAHAIQQKRTSTSIRTPTNKALVNKIERKRLSSVITPQSRTSAGSTIKRRSITVPERKSIRETQIASINRLSKPKVSVNSEKKLVVKTPVAKKIPNFSEIHKKNFAKMESIVDLKKRVENRHVTLNTASSAKKVPGSGNKPTPVDSTNGSYNRFGFKLRKNEAISMISKKQTNAVDTREKKREDARSALRGVRMNRRFELQMKSRTQNS